MDNERTLTLTLVKEEQPFLVAGQSSITGDMVFGFPYFLKTVTVDGRSNCLPCILLPVAYDDDVLPDDAEWDFAVRRGEFHPVDGDLHRFLYEDSDGRYHFEGGMTFKV